MRHALAPRCANNSNCDRLIETGHSLERHACYTAVCNRHHAIDQQLCRWLLQSLDGAAASKLDMTHESIAQMLGVRREGVSKAARSLQNAGVIHYRCGQITITDRPRLAALCCECYGVVTREYDRLLGTFRPAMAHVVPILNAATQHTRAKAHAGMLRPMPRAIAPLTAHAPARRHASRLTRGLHG
jgi:hypothetical protein